jgi:uncharacterized membrane protein
MPLLLPLLAPALVVLASCQPQGPDGAPAPPPAAAPKPAPSAAPAGMDISQPITARGTEPFWALVVAGGTRLTLKRPDHADVMFQAPGAAIEAGRAVWVARAADGQQLTLTLYASDCSDGMSDARYPMAAEVVMLNESLSGCAAKTAELPRGG